MGAALQCHLTLSRHWMELQVQWSGNRAEEDSCATQWVLILQERLGKERSLTPSTWILSLVEGCPCSSKSQFPRATFVYLEQPNHIRSNRWLSSHLTWIFTRKACTNRASGIGSQQPTAPQTKPWKKNVLGSHPRKAAWRDLFLKCFPAVSSFRNNLSLIQFVAPFPSPDFFSEGKLPTHGSL